jgi:hypothetical protein
VCCVLVSLSTSAVLQESSRSSQNYIKQSPSRSSRLHQLKMADSPAYHPSLLDSLVNHVALPPQLPGKADRNIDQIQLALTNRLLDASRILRDQTKGEFSSQWESIRNILQVCKTANASGKLNKASLLAEFARLERKDFLILHIAEQNAGLLIRRHYE